MTTPKEHSLIEALWQMTSPHLNADDIRRLAEKIIPLARSLIEENARLKEKAEAMDWLFQSEESGLPARWHYLFLELSYSGKVHKHWKDFPPVLKQLIEKK